MIGQTKTLGNLLGALFPPAGQMQAERPNPEYYLNRTVTRAMEHVTKQRPESAAKLQPSHIAADPAPAARQSGAALVPVEQVQLLVDQALDKRLAPLLHVKKSCKDCGKDLERQHFTAVQWACAEPVCTSCCPVDARFQKRLLASKQCAQCQQQTSRHEFSKTQWERGSGSVCKTCLVAKTAAQKVYTKTCSGCNAAKSQAEFSKTQWTQTKLALLKCKTCCEQALKKSQEALMQWQRDSVSKAPKQHAVEGDATLRSVEEAKRWQLEAPTDALPSVCLKSLQAMKALSGVKEWGTASLLIKDDGYSTVTGPT